MILELIWRVNFGEGLNTFRKSLWPVRVTRKNRARKPALKDPAQTALSLEVKPERVK